MDTAPGIAIPGSGGAEVAASPPVGQSPEVVSPSGATTPSSVPVQGPSSSSQVGGSTTQTSTLGFPSGQPETPKSAPPILTGPSTTAAAASPQSSSSGTAKAAAATAAAVANLSKGKSVGKIPKSRAGAIPEWDPSLANSRAALKKKSNKKNKRTKREGAWKDLSRWKPTDDLALITAVQQVTSNVVLRY